MTVEAAPASVRRSARPGLTATAARLTVIQVAGAATGFITGPLLARALGASGRGDLAAVIVPLTLVPPLVGLGIPAYAYRSLPRGERPGEVIVSLGTPLLVIGLVAAVAGVPLADLLAGGRHVVRTCLIVVFLLMPVLLVGALLQSCLSALERWPRVMVTNLTPFLIALLGIVALYAAGQLTVATAAAATIGGSLLAVFPGLVLLREARPVFRMPVALAGIKFGAKAWLGGLAALANGRLDQFMMIKLVSPRQLGLYAVAVTLAGASGLVGGGLSPPLMARIAGGERALMPAAVRIMLACTACINLALATLAPVLLVLLFGPQFGDAVKMVWILLVAQIPFTAALVLSSALQADGVPMIPTTAEVIALVVTVAGLLVLLRPLGGLGAAVVSLAAYSTSFVYQVAKARRHLGVSLRSFLIPQPADLRWAWASLQSGIAGMSAKRA